MDLNTHQLSVVKNGLPVHQASITTPQSPKKDNALFFEYSSIKFIHKGLITIDLTHISSKKFFKTTQLNTVDNILKL